LWVSNDQIPRRYKPGIERLVQFFRQKGIGDEDGEDQTPDGQHDPIGSASPPPLGTKPNQVAKSCCGPRRDLFPTIVFSLNYNGPYRTEV